MRESRLGRGRGTGKMKGLSSLHSPRFTEALSLQRLHALFCTMPCLSLWLLLGMRQQEQGLITPAWKQES